MAIFITRDDILKVKEKFTWFTVNVHTSAACNSSNILVSLVYDKQTKLTTAYKITLTGKIQAEPIRIFSYQSTLDSECESIIVYKKIFFFTANQPYSNADELGPNELVYDVSENAWKMVNRGKKFIKHYSLTSIYSRIYALGEKKFCQYDIQSGKWDELPCPNEYRCYPAAFTRFSRYVYVVMGFTWFRKVLGTYNYDMGKIGNTFEMYDIKEKKWELHTLDKDYYKLFPLMKCKCVQMSSNEIIVFGGKKEVSIFQMRLASILVAFL
jgi:hypothetical protein